MGHSKRTLVTGRTEEKKWAGNDTREKENGK